MDHGESSLIQKYSEEEIELPPGFRFHPTDEELITCYLSNKALNSSFDAIAIQEVDLNKCEPWDLPKKSKLGEKECYFFSVRGRKYQTGFRTNRATEAGYWKATGKDKEIQRGKMLVGMKKTLVFYKGRPPKGEKTDWVMHEYRLEGNYAESDWVICRVFKKSSPGSGKKAFELAVTSSFEQEMVRGAPLPPLMGAHVTCFSNSFFQDAAFNPSAGASSSFYGGCSDGEFMASTVSISPETGLSTAMTTKISFVNEAGRNSFEECLWNY